MNKNGPVVIIEDDQDDQELLKEVFKALQYKNAIVFFEDGEAALDFLNKTEVIPFLILSDINMPGMSGLELLRHIKQKYLIPPPVVMMITAYGDAENFNKAKELGADDFLTKPVDFNYLREKFKQ